MNTATAPSGSTDRSFATLRAGVLRCKLDLRRGGRIVSLRSQKTGREWLWRNLHLLARNAVPGDSYIAVHDLGGWDELLPTIEPCVAPGTPWGDRTLTDHGEIWCRPCTVVGSIEDDELTIVTNDSKLPFQWQRTYTVTNGGISIDYQLHNLSNEVMPYIWAAHPLIAIEPGMRIGMPTGTQAVCTLSLGSQKPLPVGSRFEWPGSSGLEQVMDQSAGVAMKVFASLPAGETGWVEVISVDGSEALRLSFDPVDVPHVGLWMNYGGWSGCGSPAYFNLGVEPTNYAGDSLAEAVDHGTAVCMQANGCRRWRLNVAMETR